MCKWIRELWRVLAFTEHCCRGDYSGLHSFTHPVGHEDSLVSMLIRTCSTPQCHAVVQTSGCNLSSHRLKMLRNDTKYRTLHLCSHSNDHSMSTVKYILTGHVPRPTVDGSKHDTFHTLSSKVS